MLTVEIVIVALSAVAFALVVMAAWLLLGPRGLMRD